MIITHESGNCKRMQKGVKHDAESEKARKPAGRDTAQYPHTACGSRLQAVISRNAARRVRSDAVELAVGQIHDAA